MAADDPQREREQGETVRGAVVRGVVDAFAPVTRTVESVGEHVIMLSKAAMWAVRPHTE